ncbi:NADPH:quinone oxidoreductase family protein [Hyphomicrobiales bacterium]|jgi:NADPH2:quinone reductase|nr:NADPH:quinone oxidoreductase family protein [Hyphomicrobiales bacterium]MDA9904219.1 NADPH:quinone oxidoreductase family protein [Hyphomicrobiales bacterium]MDB4247006.1 NADPH:quinone oxidoreductase family protein [Hyphomicrobiales bacterium]MDB9925526.1 NADPH:quinone oxidoreductase family protein [Hyphomicrobiales bacterium]|tara:strand:- start:488 stop:1492 length:1005 start_codon:yes stop_codon:yes gene_type:complete
MKALLCKEFGPPETLSYEDVDDPVISPGKVIVDIYSASVNFPDVLIIEDKYQFKPSLPFSPGGEASGIISEIGEGVDGFIVGDRVIVSAGWGCFVEKILVDPSALTSIPDSMDFDTAASFLMTYGTSHHALKDRADLKKGDSLLVLGAAGGVGLAAVEIGNAIGAHVIAAASTEEKVQICRDHGAKDGLVYKTGSLDRDEQKSLSNQIKDLTAGLGANVIYDPVGGDYAEPSLRAIAWEGRYLVVGFAAGYIPKIPLNLALLKGCQIVGVFWGAFKAQFQDQHNDNVADLLKMYDDGHLKPHISGVYDLSNGAKAIKDLAERKAKGKIVVKVKS